MLEPAHDTDIGHNHLALSKVLNGHVTDGEDRSRSCNFTIRPLDSPHNIPKIGRYGLMRLIVHL